MRTAAQRRLVWHLVFAVLIAFVTSTVLTWMLHERITRNSVKRIFTNVFADVAVDIRERVDEKMFRQAMALRDKVYEMREEEWWGDPDESSRKLRELAKDLGVDDISIADSDGTLSHSSRRQSVGAINFRTTKGQAREFAALLDEKYELSQSVLTNTLYGEEVKYVGVWMPEGGFVQVGAHEKALRNLSRTALTGLTHGWHVSGESGGIFITTANGTIISHPVAGREGGQWHDPGDDTYWEKRMIEGFPVYVVIPKRAAIVERRVLVATSAFLNGMALVLAAVLVGIVISGYVREQIATQRKKEMSMASDIQESSIPRVFPPFVEETRMDIFATMQPARDVGGDFYDFYFTTPTRLVFLIADVSGKGIPAALYMMRAKATIKSFALLGLSLAEVAERANDSLSRDNDANMFVTAWIGEVDLTTGALSYVNAGHNPPIAIGHGSNPPSFVRGRSGLMFGAMPGMKYKAHEMRLTPGDILYLYTDGITEQPDPNGELFGDDRLLDSVSGMLASGLHAIERDASPLLGAIFATVIAHGAGVEQADDCTQLVFRFNGDNSASRKAGEGGGYAARLFPPTQDGIAAASDFLDATLENLESRKPAESAPDADGFGLGLLSPKLHVILDEIASNIVKHSGATDFELTIGHRLNPEGVELIFSDDGVEYNPLAHTDPDTSKPVEDRPIGGLGIMMVKKMATSVAYSRAGGRNVFTVVLQIPG